MNSFQELNNYAAIDLEFTDLRPAGVVFDRAAGTNSSLTVNEGQTFNMPIGAEIEEIINYQDAATYYQINVSNIAGATVSWASVPAGLTVTNPSAGVYRIQVIKNVTDWTAIRTATVTLPNAYYGVTTITGSISGGGASRTWTVNLTVNNVILLTTPTDFYYLTDRVETLTGYPQIQDDGTNPGLTYTVEVQPQYDLNGITNMSCGGTGGSVSYNAGTKTLTIVGTKTQVNSRLANIQVTFTPENDLDFPLRYIATASVTGESDTVFQALLGNDTTILGRPRADETYTVNTATSFSGGPLITDSPNPGTGIYTLDIYPGDLAAFGSLTAPNVNSNFEYQTAITIQNFNSQQLGKNSRIAISEDGKTMAIGNPDEDFGGFLRAGYVYVYIRQLDDTWVLEQKFRTSDTDTSNLNDADFKFGDNLTISGDGNMLAITGYYDDNNPSTYGPPIYIFTRTAGVWSQQQRLYAQSGLNTAHNIENEFTGGQGFHISNDKSTLAVCGSSSVTYPYGTVILYSRSGNTFNFSEVVGLSATVWTDEPSGPNAVKLNDDGTAFITGHPLAASDNTAPPGDPANNFNSNGGVLVYKKTGGVWAREFEANTIYAGTTQFAQLVGWNVAINGDGTKFAYSTPGRTVGGFGNSGAVTIYTKSNGVWSYTVNLYDPNLASNRYYGRTLQLSRDGRTMVVGATGHNTNQGRMYAYYNNVNTQTLTDPDTDSILLGYAGALSGSGGVLVAQVGDTTPGYDYVWHYIWKKPVTASYSASTKTLTIQGTRTGVNSLIDSLTFTPATGYNQSFDMLYYLSTPTNVQSLRNQPVDPV